MSKSAKIVKKAPNAKRDAAFKKIVEACKELGWTICPLGEDTTCQGVIAGEAEYLEDNFEFEKP